MDPNAAIFLLSFLSVSSLATLGICFVELRSCWRSYRERQAFKQRIAALAFEDNEFLAVCLAAAAAAEEGEIEPMTTFNANGNDHYCNRSDNCYQDTSMEAMDTGVSISDEEIIQQLYNLYHSQPDPNRDTAHDGYNQ